MSLPKDWEIYAGIAFHAMIQRMGSLLKEEEVIAKAIDLGIKMAKAVEAKDDEDYEQKSQD